MPDTTPDGAAADAARPTLPPFPAQASPAAPPSSVQVLDRLGDIVGVVAITVLCLAGKIGGLEAVIAIGALLGVGTGLRQAGARTGVAAGLGVVGLLALAAPRWGAALAGGAAAAARAGGLAALALFAALSLGCAGGPGGVEAAALKAGVTVLEGASTVRRYVCSRALDPLLGDPRPAEPSADVTRSSGGQAPAPAPTPAPAPSSPPALPPPPAPAPAIEGDAGAPDDAAAPAGDGG